MAANQTANILKVNQISKDFNIKSKDLAEILAGEGIEYKAQKVLEPVEFDILFSKLTMDNQIKGIEDYLDGITYIPSKNKAEEKVEKQEEVKAETKVEVKAEVKTEVKEVKEEVKETAPKAPEKKAVPEVKVAPAEPENKEPAPKVAQTAKAILKPAFTVAAFVAPHIARN